MEQTPPFNFCSSPQPKRPVSATYTALPVHPVGFVPSLPVVHDSRIHPPQQPLLQTPPALKKGYFTSLRWWWPEILAALCAIAALAGIIWVARSYRGRSIEAVGLPSGLSINGLIALLATVTRAALLIPVASALSQEVWLWLSVARHRSTRWGELRDFEISDEASRGAWGSLLLLRHFRRR